LINKYKKSILNYELQITNGVWDKGVFFGRLRLFKTVTTVISLRSPT